MPHRRYGPPGRTEPSCGVRRDQTIRGQLAAEDPSTTVLHNLMERSGRLDSPIDMPSSGDHRSQARALPWRTVAGVSSVCLAVALAGCGSSSPPSAAPNNPTTLAPTPLSSTTNTTATATTAACLTSELTARLASSPTETPGQDHVAVVLTNKSSIPCKMYGFPGFELIGPLSNGTTTYSPTRQASSPVSVLVDPGRSAHAWFTFLIGPDICDANGRAWGPTAAVITPPDQTSSITLAWDRCIRRQLPG